MIKTACLGYPRLGINRELKRILERFWKGEIEQDEMKAVAVQLRRYNWELMSEVGLDYIPSNDFSLYDQVLDTSMMVGAIPERFKVIEEVPEMKTYFAMARGYQENGLDLPAMEMTKWFDTNYHYIVPEFEANQDFHYLSSKAVQEFLEAKELGVITRPVLLGPVSYLLLGKSTSLQADPLTLLEKLLPVYQVVLEALAKAGAVWVQIDEPCLCLDLKEQASGAFKQAYEVLAHGNHPKVMLATYFGAIADNLELALNLPVDGLHIDLVQAPKQLTAILDGIHSHQILSLGVVDGRNVWKTDLNQALALVEAAIGHLGASRVMVAPSCSLLFCPYDLDLEISFDEEIRSWLSFAKQKLLEVILITKAANGEDVSAEFEANRQIVLRRQNASRTYDANVRMRMKALTPSMFRRKSPYSQRKQIQAAAMGLPLLPTTTIGSFPQTREIRMKRAAYLRGELSEDLYLDYLRTEIRKTIKIQEEIDLDVLVHGEYERTDMVEYFGQQLTGFCFTEYGWVQSYGSRGVRPPIIFGDISRTSSMTTAWSQYAQSLTERPVKGMLTGPVTILEWSFVRDDQPRSETCLQIALALRDEVADLEAHGITIIQIDEPAFREGLPLRRSEWDEYLSWAVDCFRLASSGVADQTQIHTHMCYAEFNDIIQAIVAMDADVISIEASRSRMELLNLFDEIDYPNEIGPGIYDIHSPRVPSQDEIEELLRRGLQYLRADQVWVNPDCGLKTRGWDQVIPSLKAMVAAAKSIRKEI